LRFVTFAALSVDGVTLDTFDLVAQAENGRA
jgi:hypothetical protein